MNLELTIEEKYALMGALEVRIEKVEHLIQVFKNDEDRYPFESFTKTKEGLVNLLDKLKNYHND
jgi:hypothetical protein